MVDDFRDVQRTAVDDAKRWFGDQVANDITIAALGMNGEAGEFADLVKKMARGSIKLDADTIEKMRNEVTDTFIYVIEAAEMLDFDILDRYLNHHRPINEIRFGERKGSNGTRPE